ncbi:MAG: carbohydrate ABC transporter permease [Clostridiales bacterium]|jgi:multiple sugar transport system permease protein|nr:carbohydrate ABC transporter permease [Clostridiales bacterium]
MAKAMAMAKAGAAAGNSAGMKKKGNGRLRFCGINPPRFDRGQIKIWAYMLPIAAIMALPILFIIGTAFKPLNELFAYPPRLMPKRFTLNSFRELFGLDGQNSVGGMNGIPITRFMLNSVLSSAAVVFLSLLFSVSAGYVLSKKDFRGRRLLFSINTVALMFAPAAVMIPRFFVVYYTGMTDSFAAHIFPGLAMPVGLFLVKQFIDQMPDALFDAAKMDGANDYFILARIVAPMVAPALVTVAILAFQQSWNALEPSNVYINRDALKTLPYFMSIITDRSTGRTVAGLGASAAANLVIFAPNLALFVFLQSRVMNTMAHSGIK